MILVLCTMLGSSGLQYMYLYIHVHVHVHVRYIVHATCTVSGICTCTCNTSWSDTILHVPQLVSGLHTTIEYLYHSISIYNMAAFIRFMCTSCNKMDIKENKRNTLIFQVVNKYIFKQM